VLILQDDSFEDTGSVTICLLTSHAMDAPLVRPAIEPSPDNGLRETSYAMVDKLTTVKRARLGRRIGTAAPPAMTAVSRAILVFLGLVGSGRA
jgi:mRNA interferase MazF